MRAAHLRGALRLSRRRIFLRARWSCACTAMSTCGKIPTLCRNSDDDMRAIFSRAARRVFSASGALRQVGKRRRNLSVMNAAVAHYSRKNQRAAGAEKAPVRASRDAPGCPQFAASIRRHCVCGSASRAVPARRVDDDVRVCDIASRAVLQTYWPCARRVCIRLPGRQFEPAMRAAALKKIDAAKIFSRRINALRMDVAVMRPVARGVMWAGANASRRRLRVHDGAVASRSATRFFGAGTSCARAPESEPSARELRSQIGFAPWKKSRA